MIDIRIRYQASIFVDVSDIIPNPDIITSLIDIFRDKNLIPSTFQEIGVSPGEMVRLRLSTTDNEWEVAFASKRIDINKNALDKNGSGMGELSIFCSDALDIFERISSKFNKRARRLTLNTTGMLEEMTKSKLATVYSKLFKPPKLYEENPPIEWDWRSVSNIPINILELEEMLNIVTVLKRVRGHVSDGSGIFKFDRLQFSPDINTIGERQETRFDFTHLKDFLPKAIDIHNILLEQIEEHISD